MTQINLSYMLACLYMRATEEYDRSLTDERSRYDPTEAFLTYYNDMKSHFHGEYMGKAKRKSVHSLHDGGH